MDTERIHVIDRIVATNDGNGYDTALYREVFYALGEIYKHQYDLLCKHDCQLINPITHGYKLGCVGTPEVQVLLHILNDYPIDLLESVASILEHYQTLTYAFDDEDAYWNTGYDSN